MKDSDPELYAELFDGRSSRHCFMSIDGRYIYHIGIIDYLQDFNFEKWVETKFKSIVFTNGNDVSSIPPEPYAERFFQFMKRQVIMNQVGMDDDGLNKEVTLKEQNDKFDKSFKDHD